MADDVGLSPEELDELCDTYETAMEAALEALASGNMAKAEQLLQNALGEPDEDDDDEDDEDDEDD
jgi:exonuclease VII small subunit